MAKEEWGTKRVCPTTGKRFYDLNREPVISPYTGEVVEIDTGKSRALTTEKSTEKESQTDDDQVVLEDDDKNEADVDLEDDVLDDDDDSDNVSLDDLADVASDDSDT